MSVETDNKALQLDLKEIYLGNLSTVDSDLNFPKYGKRGTVFSWESKEILFISHGGKVTRPTFGVGNREVILVVTGTLNGQVEKKEFTATVLEEIPKNKIIRAEPLTLSLKNAQSHLPTVCVVLLDNGNYSTAKVKWLDTINPKKEEQIIEGKVEGGECSVSLTVIKDEKPVIVPKRKTYSLPTQLMDNSVFKKASLRMLEYLRGVSLDQLLYNFREAAQLSTKGVKPMTGWDAPECNLKGHTTGHYLSAFALAAYSTQKKEFYDKVDYLVEGLEECQIRLEKLGMHEGYLSAYSEKQFDLLEVYTTYPTIWAPYYTLDKLLQGLLDSYEYAGSKKAFKMARKIGDWTYNRLSKLNSNQLNKMWSIYIAGEFGGMISALMRLYHFTGKVKYLDTALFFENDKLYVPMQENFDTLDGVHANQHIPQIIGALDIFEETGETKYLDIARNFWKMVTMHHTYSIGGVGETEMFKAADAIAAFLTNKSAESCASYNMLKLTKKLYDLSPQAEYFDYYENVLHNHLLSAASHCCDGGTTYFMPSAPGAHKHFDTEENSCCHGSGLESLLRFQKDIYAFSESSVYVNLFYPSQVKWAEKDIIFYQTINKNEFSFTWEGTGTFELKVRLPQWITIEKIYLDEKEEELKVADGYLLFNITDKNKGIRISYKLLKQVFFANDDPSIGSLVYGRDILVIISSEKKFIEIDHSEIGNLIETPEGYQVNNHYLLPLNAVNEEAYHLYLKIK